MALVVQKFGGSSVSDVAAIRRVARRVVETHRADTSVAVVVSAMGDTTDDLLDLAREVSSAPPERELDMLLTAGERISMAVLAMAISELGVPARSFTGEQAGMRTDAAHGRARLLDVTPDRVRGALRAGEVAIVAGFQGINHDLEDVTTLGRGGSDTTAVALAAALDADVCEIYTDVDGLYTADPRIVPSARRITRITMEETLEMAAHGAKILHLRAVEYARRFGVPLHVRSSFSDLEGTHILIDRPLTGRREALLPPTPTAPRQDAGSTSDHTEAAMEEPLISGIAHESALSKVTAVGIPDRPGVAARVVGAIAAVDVSIDMIVQNISTDRGARTDMSFTVPEQDGETVVSALEQLRTDLGFTDVLYPGQIGKLSLVGAGLRSNPEVASRLFGALAEAGVNIEMISTSEIRISVICAQDDLARAVRATHTAFGLDAESDAVVYAGSGR